MYEHGHRSESYVHTELINADMSCLVQADFHCITAGGNQGVATGEAGESGKRGLQPGPQGGGQHQGRVWAVYW